MYIDIGGISELTTIDTANGFSIGGGVPLGEIITKLDEMAASSPNYPYATRMANHIRKVC